MKPNRNLPFSAVELDNGFWHDRQELNRNVTIRNVWKRFEETGRFASFRFDWKEGMPHKPHIFYDSDVAKWMESAAFILQMHPDPWLEERMEELVGLIVAHQQEDGYFNVYFTVVEPENRFRQRFAHELYCAGHLIEAAVAYQNATGRDRFLRAMCRYADCIARVFMEEQAPPFATPGHEEIELALVKLYRCTGEERYLRLARWFLDQRGNNDKDPACMGEWENPRYTQSHLPVRRQFTAEGHAVRAGYLYSAMADVAYETGDPELRTACQSLFENITERRMYITGGMGSSRTGEAFTKDFDLPNATAYAETCAAISLILFAQRMLLLDIDGRYADVVERALYNGFLSGLSLDGRSFFYENPLEIDLDRYGRDTSIKGGEVLPIPQRVEVFECSCCPPNVTRLIASVGEYLATYDDHTVFIHQYMSGTARWQIGNQAVTLRQETRYPADGHIRLTIEGARGMKAALRIPGWCRRYTLLCGGQPVQAAPEKGYVAVNCLGDMVTLELELDMSPVLLEADPRIHADAGRAALQRGPVVYCVEGADHEGAVHDLLVDGWLKARTEELPGMPLPVVRAAGWRRPRPEPGCPYRPLRENLQPLELTYIPYFAFANRGESDMLVWVPVRR